MDGWLLPYRNDLWSLIASVLMLAAYHLFVYIRSRGDPYYTVQAVNAAARKAWVHSVMSSTNKDVLAVQTLRNAIMGPTFLASTAILLVIGLLNVSGQSDKLSETWHALNIAGATDAQLWLIKLLLLILDFFVAFFAFTLSIRFFIHVGFMINVPESHRHRAISPEHVAQHLNKAGAYHRIGIRAYYYSVPLLFWLFGPHLMVIATIGLIAVLRLVDRAPKVLADDYR
jgi:uncharacterized membrane protein